MNEKAYAKAVARRLACSKARRDEFVRDLESDIASSLADGETRAVSYTHLRAR